MPAGLAAGVIFELVQIEPFDVFDSVHESIIKCPMCGLCIKMGILFECLLLILRLGILAIYYEPRPKVR
jgi:hypothetical protein